MKRRVELALIAFALALLTSCAGRGPAGKAQAEKLAAWLQAQSYSTWSTFKHEGGSPERPASPDGLTLGSPNVFAAVGCNPDDLTSLDVFYADRRTVRVLPRPLTLALRMQGRAARNHPGPVPLADFPDQTLRRLRHTAIAVSESQLDGLRVTSVTFAPMGPDQNFLIRWFLFENTGQSTHRLHLAVRFLASDEWSSIDAHTWQRGDHLALVSDAPLATREEDIEADIGSLRPGQQAAAALLFIAVEGKEALADDIARAQAAIPNLLEVLDSTRSEWTEWCAQTPLATGNTRTDDLLDSLLCLTRAHVGPKAIHTGSLRYSHDRAYVRDSYWVQRALLELGRVHEARVNLDFFHRAWRASGIASYYEIPVSRAAGYGYQGVELPHYLVLMARDAERLAGIDGLTYWDMVQGCLDDAAVPPDGLQPMNGDETWLLAAPARELDDMLDNSWLLIASAEYGAELAARAGDPDRAARYQVLASQARRGLRRFLPRPGDAEWYAAGRGGDGSLDLSLCPGVLARGAILDVLPATDPHLSAGLTTSWNRLSFDRGIRAHSRSATIDGGTPGYVLQAAAASPGCSFPGELARRVPKLASATGCVWEFHDMHDPAWGGEKRRLWDSAVLLMGLVRTYFDVRSSEAGLEFIAKPMSAASPPPPAPAFDAEALLSQSGPALVRHRRSPEHAARLARELLRHRNHQYAIADYPGQTPANSSAIIISPANAPAGWHRTIRGYWTRTWDGPPQIWVRDKGHVYLDTDPLLTDLLSWLVPQRENPLPFPDANFGLVARFGESPSGRAELLARSGFRTARGRLELAGGRVTLSPGKAELTSTAAYDSERRLLNLSVSAAAPRPDEAELTITLPSGWWVVYARHMTGPWDRVRDPVHQLRLSDGRSQLVYSFRPGDRPIHLTFQLARLAVKTL